MSNDELQARIDQIEQRQIKMLELLETVTIKLNAHSEVQGEALGGIEYQVQKIAQVNTRLMGNFNTNITRW